MVQQNTKPAFCPHGVYIVVGQEITDKQIVADVCSVRSLESPEKQERENGNSEDGSHHCMWYFLTR